MHFCGHQSVSMFFWSLSWTYSISQAILEEQPRLAVYLPCLGANVRPGFLSEKAFN